jgi:uncharacterized membrane protein YfcA
MKKMTRCIAYFNLFNGVALCLGSLLGGLLLQKLPPLLGYKILTLLLVSSLFRLVVSFLMPRHLKEVREVAKVSHQDLLLSVIGVRSVEY